MQHNSIYLCNLAPQISKYEKSIGNSYHIEHLAVSIHAVYRVDAAGIVLRLLCRPSFALLLRPSAIGGLHHLAVYERVWSQYVRCQVCIVSDNAAGATGFFRVGVAGAAQRS